MRLSNPLHHRPTVLRLAMLCLLLFSVAGILARHATSVWVDRIDGIRGTLLGMQLALTFWFFRLGGDSRCGKAS